MVVVETRYLLSIFYSFLASCFNSLRSNPSDWILLTREKRPKIDALCGQPETKVTFEEDGEKRERETLMVERRAGRRTQKWRREK